MAISGNNTPTDRMLLALHDATAAHNDNHNQVHHQLRAWLEQLGRQKADALYAAQHAQPTTTGGAADA